MKDMGVSIQPTSDAINVAPDTFAIATENVFVDNMIQRQDSFLLGSFNDAKFGTTQADILAQVNCPIGFKFPPRSQPDSAKVVLYYRTWFGDSYSPMNVNIYEMNKSTFQYTKSYPSNLDPSVYTDKSILMSNMIFSAKDALKTRIDSTSIIFKLSKSFVTRFFPDTTKTYYTGESDFTNNFFKGMYITADFGTATMLNISQIDLDYYFHYTYNKLGKDTVVNNVITFPANSEVRQVNRFLHPDTTAIRQQLNAKPNVNYVSSPANIQSRVIVTLRRIKTRMATVIGNKKLILNSAIVKVEATELDSSALHLPMVQYMLLIKEPALTNFFKTNQLPSDTCSILASYTKSLNSTTGLYEYYYSFNIAKLIANELKNANYNKTELADKLLFRLVPVTVKYTTNSSTGTSTLTSVKQQPLMSAVTIKSGQNSTSPMRLSMVYSGF
jgi:hypothetical protein